MKTDAWTQYSPQRMVETETQVSQSSNVSEYTVMVLVSTGVQATADTVDSVAQTDVEEKIDLRQFHEDITPHEIIANPQEDCILELDSDEIDRCLHESSQNLVSFKF